MITIIGLGPGDADGLSRSAERALRDASARMQAGTGVLYLRTDRHPIVSTLRSWRLRFETFDRIYESGTDFATVYSEIVAAIMASATSRPGEPFHVAYAVPGHPLLGEDSVRMLIDSARDADLDVRLVSSGSFVEAILTAVGAPVANGCDVRDALTLKLGDAVDFNGDPIGARFDTQRGLILFQVFDTASASHTKLCLMRDYPDDWEVVLIRAAAVEREQTVRQVPLHRLDRESFDHLTSVYVPPLPPSIRPRSFASLVGVMARLRAPDGCPWDREQTPQTLKRYLIEETYEALEAIDNDDSEALCEELGDVLLQVVFHAQLAAEVGLFTIDDVTAGIVTKLIRRHPHVFGSVEVRDSDEVLVNWNRIKQEEKSSQASRSRESILDGIPHGLPALMHAMELSKRVVKVGFEWPTLEEVVAKLDEELEELKAELGAEPPAYRAITDEIGDLLFTVVQVARWHKIDPEEALRTMLRRFTERFRFVEDSAREQGRQVSDLKLAEMNSLWEEAKGHRT